MPTSDANHPARYRSSTPHYIDTEPVSDDFRLRSETHDLLSVKTQNALLRAGYISTEQLLRATSKELLDIRWFGQAAYGEYLLWREAVLNPDQNAYSTLHNRLTRSLEDYGCPCPAVVASGVIRTLRDCMADGFITPNSRLEQLLSPPQIEA